VTPRAIIRAARHLLLDFDGPVCAVFGNLSDHEVADALRAELKARDVAYPGSIAQANDPFDVLRFASQVATETAKCVEQRFREFEYIAVQNAPATPGAADLLRRAAEGGQLVTIVSNNSTAAVRRYLELEGLSPFVCGISARDDAVVERLKPAPFLLQQAMITTSTNRDECVMIGDSVTDIEAARAAGTKVIAYANKPGKQQRFITLVPDGMITNMTEL
jgi:HAD superfamily hydrolase (TIGR01549 family)